MTETVDSVSASLAGTSPVTCDVAVGVHITVLQRAIDILYAALYPRAFAGSASSGEHVVSWDVRSAPTLDFSPTPGLAAALQKHLEALPPPEEPVAIAATSGPMSMEALAASVDAATVKLRFPAIDVGVTAGGSRTTTTIAVVVYVTISTQRGRVQFTPARAEVTSPAPGLDAVLNAVVFPAALTIAGQVFAAIQLPDLNPGGAMALDWPGAEIAHSYLVITANRANNHRPPGLDLAIPAGNHDAFILLSRHMLMSALSLVAGVARNFTTQGSRDLGITTVRWDADVKLSDLRASAAELPLPVKAAVTGRARGWITTFLGDVGTGFTASATPDPSGTIDISIDPGRNTIRGRLTNVSTFMVLFTPTGSFVSQVLGYAVPALTLFASTISPAMALILKNIAFDVWSIPDIVVAHDHVRVTIHPSNLSVRQAGSTVQVTGSVTLT